MFSLASSPRLTTSGYLISRSSCRNFVCSDTRARFRSAYSLIPIQSNLRSISSTTLKPNPSVILYRYQPLSTNITTAHKARLKKFTSGSSVSAPPLYLGHRPASVRTTTSAHARSRGELRNASDNPGSKNALHDFAVLLAHAKTDQICVGKWVTVDDEGATTLDLDWIWWQGLQDESASEYSLA